MNLQPATSNPAPPHAAAAKAAASATGSNASAATAAAADAIDFAALLAQSLPAAIGLPTRDSTAAAAKDDKAVATDPSLANPANPASVVDPLVSRAAALAAQPTNDSISATTPKAGFGMAEQLHAALSATNSMALGLTAAKPAVEHPESALAASRSDVSQLSSEAQPAAAQFSAALKSVAAATDSQTHAALNAIDSTPLQPDRAVAIPLAPAPSSLAAPTPLRLDIPAPLSAAGWDQQLGQHVVWMSNQHNQTAELRINPPDLGPIEMRLTLDQNGQQASLHFSSPHPEVRETIENAMPRLREMLADAGIALGNATVGGESLPRQTTPEQNRAPQGATATSLNESNPVESTRTIARRGNGLVDTFA